MLSRNFPTHDNVLMHALIADSSPLLTIHASHLITLSPSPSHFRHHHQHSPWHYHSLITTPSLITNSTSPHIIVLTSLPIYTPSSASPGTNELSIISIIPHHHYHQDYMLHSHNCYPRSLSSYSSFIPPSPVISFLLRSSHWKSYHIHQLWQHSRDAV